MRVGYKAKAVEQLRALPRADRERILNKIAFYAAQSDPLAFAKPLAGYNAYRFRIGNFRALVETEGDSLLVLLIVPREGAYRHL